MQRNNKKGFTLIELLIVIAIIAVLAAAVFVALDPLTRFSDARDATRASDITQILSAIKIDNTNTDAFSPPYTHNSSKDESIIFCFLMQ